MKQQDFLRKYWLIVLISIGIFLAGICFTFYPQTITPYITTTTTTTTQTTQPTIPAGVLTTSNILSNPVNYNGKTVKVFGKVTELGKLRCTCFTLDNKSVIVQYIHDDINLYPTEIKDKINNGDYVVATGKFIYDNSTGGGDIQLEKIEKT
jgi:hypothetical protein